MGKAGRVQKQRVIPSMPTLIAWLSLCLLAAAVGHALDDRWQQVWIRMGTFGLVAAVGLGALEKSRELRERSIYDRLMKARVEGGLARFNEHSAAIDSINEALGRLTAHASRTRRGKLAKTSHAPRHDGTQLLDGYPLEILPVDDCNPALDFDAGRAIAGTVRQISSRVVAFQHGAPLGTRMALLTFRLAERDQLSFVVDVMWTERDEIGYVSGGTLLAVGVPDVDHREVELASACDS